MTWGPRFRRSEALGVQVQLGGCWDTSGRVAHEVGGDPEQFTRSRRTMCLQLLPARDRHDCAPLRGVTTRGTCCSRLAAAWRS